MKELVSLNLKVRLATDIDGRSPPVQARFAAARVIKRCSEDADDDVLHSLVDISLAIWIDQSIGIKRMQCRGSVPARADAQGGLRDCRCGGVYPAKNGSRLLEGA